MTLYSKISMIQLSFQQHLFLKYISANIFKNCESYKNQQIALNSCNESTHQ